MNILPSTPAGKGQPRRWLQVIAAIGIGCGTVLLMEVGGVVAGILTPPAGFWAGVVTSLPFVGGLIYSNQWVDQSALSPARYQHLGWWCLAGLLVFTVIILAIMLTVPVFMTRSWVFFLGTVRWSASLGAGTGLALGLFQARAIERAQAAEHHRLRKEMLEHERDRLSEFAEIVAHDLRNPLQVAEGHRQLLETESSSEHLDGIARAHARMRTIIDETLTLAQQGQLVSEMIPVALGDLATQCWRDIGSERATLQIEDSGVIEGDPDRLRHLFENMFQNAIDHGGDDVTIRVGMLAKTNGFYIEDTGDGIPTNMRETVFKPGETTAPDGTGFGLAIVRRIVEAHDWDIRVTESAAGGARFEITGIDTVE